MKSIEIKGEIHDAFYTFETSLIGKACTFLKTPFETCVLIPLYNLAAEDSRLTSSEVDSVYINESYFLFQNVLSLSNEGAVHNADKKEFVDRFSETHLLADDVLGLSEYTEYELGGFGLMETGATYDGKFKISCKKVFLIIPDSSTIMKEYPGSINLQTISSETKKFLLADPSEIFRTILRIHDNC